MDTIRDIAEFVGFFTVLIGGAALIAWPCVLWIQQLASV